MILKTLLLQHFRSYPNARFDFSPEVSIIVGKNTAGKTNLIEAIHLLSVAKSFRIDKDEQMISFGQEIARIKAGVIEEDGKKVLEVVLAKGQTASGRLVKRYAVNDISKRRVDFAGMMPSVLFSPEELDIVNAGPSLRRKFLDDVLEQVDKDYRQSIGVYEKAIKQRNALLSQAKETGVYSQSQFHYWNELVINNGQVITQKREEFVEYMNASPKKIFDAILVYDKSSISHERLLQYQSAERASGVTLVGPHRDEVLFYLAPDQEVRYYGSRGQQRLVVLQLKLFQLTFIEKLLGKKPLLLLDDIFSELDEGHMRHVMDMVSGQQVIMTTTHKEFIHESHLDSAHVIELPYETV